MSTDRFPIPRPTLPPESAHAVAATDEPVEEPLEMLAPTTVLEANARLEEFTSTVAHDLKSPLITIDGLVRELAAEVAAGRQAEAELTIQEIAQATGRMHQLLDQLLMLARSGQEVRTATPCPLAEVLEEAIALVRPGLRHERQVAIHFDRDLPTLCGARTRLVELFQNLIDNALKFTGGVAAPAISIEVDPRSQDLACDAVQIVVRDNGCGIAPADLVRVFEPFEKGHAGRGGSGLGLAIARRIVAAHGGRIWAHSDGQTGTGIYLTLPRG